MSIWTVPLFVIFSRKCLILALLQRECLMSFPLLSVQIKFTSFTVSIELLFLDRLMFCRFKFYSKHLKLKVRNKLTSRILILLQPIINSIFIFVWRFRHHSIHIKGFWPRRNHLGACVCMLFSILAACLPTGAKTTLFVYWLMFRARVSWRSKLWLLSKCIFDSALLSSVGVW